MSKAVSPVETELLEVTGFVPKKKHSERQDYLDALARAVNAIDDNIFEQLSEQAADWSEQAAQAIRNGKEVKDFSDFKLNGQVMGIEETSVDMSDKNELDNIDISPPTQIDNEYEDHLQEDQYDDHVIEFLNSQDSEPKKKKKKASERTDKPESITKERKTRARTAVTNKWGVAVGTKADIVCQLISRPQGATMKEIVAATGQTQYNLCNRLQRKKFNIRKEGLTIKLD